MKFGWRMEDVVIAKNGTGTKARCASIIRTRPSNSDSVRHQPNAAPPAESLK
jgi:hypothetical protein